MRETWMDALRGLAMLLVVILHAGLALAEYASYYPRAIEVFNDVFEPYRMPTLMFLSGMLLYKSLSKNAGTYFGGKARKIAWPYVLWTVIALTLQGDLTLYAMGRAVYNPVETHLWYLWFLVIFYALAWLIDIARVPYWIPAILALAASAFMPADFRLDKATFLFAFFMLGALFTRHRGALGTALYRPAVLVFGLMLAGVASAVNVVNRGGVIYEPAFAACVIGALIVAMWTVKRIPAGRVRAGIEYLGVSSIILYVVHLLVIKVAGTLMQGVGMDSPWLMFPALVVLALGVSVGLMILTSRWQVARWLFEWKPRARSQALRQPIA